MNGLATPPPDTNKRCKEVWTTDEWNQFRKQTESRNHKLIVCFSWALGHIPEMLPYHQQADPKLTNKLPSESVELLMNKATLRSGE